MHPTFGRAIYFSLQWLRREPVLKALRELYKSQWLSRDELEDLQFQRMKKIVDFAYKYVEFYRKLYQKAGVCPEDIKHRDDVRHLPIITREMIKRNVGELTGLDKPSYPAKTAGTTGQSLTLRVDNTSWAYHHANIFRTLSWFGVEPRSPEARIWGRRIDPSARRMMFIKDFLFNRLRMNAFDIEREAPTYTRKLLRFKPNFIYGYPSAILQFTEYLKHSGIKLPSVKVVACSAEHLTTFQRETIEEYFKVKITDIYGAAEVGIIASQCPEGGRHIPAESIWVDIEGEEELLPGQKSGNVVVTDLHNYVMPIIRYSIGDRSILRFGVCTCGRGLPLLGEIQGRQLEFIKTRDGRKVNSAIAYYLFKGLEARKVKLKQYQLIQKKPDYFCIKIVPQNKLRNSDRIYLIDTLKYYLGQNITVLVEEVTHIPLTQSGKHEIFIKDHKEW